MESSLQIVTIDVPLAWIPGGIEVVYSAASSCSLRMLSMSGCCDGVLVRRGMFSREQALLEKIWEHLPGVPVVAITDSLLPQNVDVPVLKIPETMKGVVSAVARQRELMSVLVLDLGGKLPSWSKSFNTINYDCIENICPSMKMLGAKKIVVCPNPDRTVDDYVLSLVNTVVDSSDELSAVVLLDHPTSDWGEVESFPVVHSQQYVWEGSRQIALPVTIAAIIAAKQRPCGAHAS